MPESAEMNSSRGGWRAFAAIGALALLLTNLPYLVVLFVHRPGFVFSGVIGMPTYADTLTYLAKMRAGGRGDWLYTSPFTPEALHPVPLFIFYLLLGKAAKLLSLPNIIVFHAARLGASVLLVWALARMTAILGLTRKESLTAFALALFAGGIAGAGQLSATQVYPTDAFAFLSMMSLPHLTLISALMLFMLADIYRIGAATSSRFALLRLALLGFILAWVHPRILLNVLTIGATAALLSYWRERRPLRPWIAAFASVLAGSVFPALYIWLGVRGEPLWNARTASPELMAYFFDGGLLWPLAAAGGWMALRSRAPWASFVVAWFVVAVLLPYVPIDSQRRLIQGLCLPLSFLAGHTIVGGGSAWIGARGNLNRGYVWMLAVVLALGLTFSTMNYLYARVREAVGTDMPAYYLEDRKRAMDWLGQNAAPGDVVLSAFISGTFIPSLSDARVVAGHWGESLDLETKMRELNEFFDAGTPTARRVEILDRYHVRFVFYGPSERQLGSYQPSADPARFTTAYRNTAVAIYERRR